MQCQKESTDLLNVSLSEHPEGKTKRRLLKESDFWGIPQQVFNKYCLTECINVLIESGPFK